MVWIGFESNDSNMTTGNHKRLRFPLTWDSS